MEVLIREDYEELSLTAAKIIAYVVRRQPHAVLGLPTGATPLGTYRELIRVHTDEGLDFSQVTTFNLDEYLGLAMDPALPYDRDQSYRRFMWEELFQHLEIPNDHVHIPNGKAADPLAECRRYEDEIRRSGGIDLLVLGIGRDGHWGFNEPGTSLDSRTQVVVLAEKTIEDNWKQFFEPAGFVKDDVPSFAITMGIGTILEAKEIVVLASGAAKADALAQALEGPVTSMVTASAIQLHAGRSVVIADESAASKLRLADYHRRSERLKAHHGLCAEWN